MKIPPLWSPTTEYIGTGECVGSMEPDVDGYYVLRTDYDALAARLAEAERLIEKHNAGCLEACEAMGSRRCDAYTSRAMLCPDCPRDWLIERTPDSAAATPLVK